MLQQADATAFPAQHRRYLPCADVAAFVEHFWMVRWDLRGLPARTVETLPHPSVHVVVEAGGASRVGGVHSGRFARVLEGEGRVFGIKFRPGGFFPLWMAPLSDLVDRSLALTEVFGDAGLALEAAILALDEDEWRMVAAERFLRERLPMPDENVALIDRLVSRVVADRELRRVDDLAALSGLSKRGLQRLFNQYIGISPKWMIQRYRLHEALDELAGHEAPNWAQFALGLGYFDQAHFIKDFKAMVGRTPAQYAAQRPAGL
ncbi:MAG: helix-turn-helix domain-containing protein [Phenylobacterium sp.]|uniref:AraC family transcriptional regulator n=1 Tax=Phenylobacterium sp. TaxID=1871053 RepID=UPI0027350476|nr:AraC family transcriptional regulator [Phenylobacterium sp.]MDP3749545.1 helix-turn-helix domain-containing protein [Phenylobacterium sp.]